MTETERDFRQMIAMKLFRSQDYDFYYQYPMLSIYDGLASAVREILEISAQKTIFLVSTGTSCQMYVRFIVVLSYIT